MQQCTWEPLAEAAAAVDFQSMSCDRGLPLRGGALLGDSSALVVVVDFQSIAAILASGTVRPFAYHAMTCGLSIALAQLGNTG